MSDVDSAAELNYISLYSGGGGLDLGFKLAVPSARAVCYVERDIEACGLLATKMAQGELDEAPLWTDADTFDGKPWRGVVDFIIGGFSCQPWSVQGLQRGVEDERWAWPTIERIVREVEPAGLFLENVPNLLDGGIQPILGSLSEMGFDAQWGCLHACAVGAPHPRERLFILAYSYKAGFNPKPINQRRQTPRHPGRNSEPGVGRVAYGMARRVDALERLGNGVVPQQAATAFRRLWSELNG